MLFEPKRKPEDIIDAFQWTGGPDQTEDPEWLVELLQSGKARITTNPLTLSVEIEGGWLTSKPGYWIIRKTTGEIITAEDWIFQLNYQPAIESSQELDACIDYKEGINEQT